MAARVNLRFFLTMISPVLVLMSRVARWPGSSSSSTDFSNSASLLQVDGLGGVVVVEDLLGGALELERVLLRGVRHRAQGADEHRGRQLAAPVDAHVQQVLVVELEVDPRAAVRDDAGVVEQLARRVALALVVVEEGTRAAVQLADHDALGAVDDEGAVLGHQRDFAEVDLLLLHVADGLGAGLLVLVPDDQAHDDLDGRGVGHPALVALVDVVLRLLEVVADELQRAGLVEVPDREDRLEDALKPDVLALLRARCRPGGTSRRTASGC